MSAADLPPHGSQSELKSEATALPPDPRSDLLPPPPPPSAPSALDVGRVQEPRPTIHSSLSAMMLPRYPGLGPSTDIGRFGSTTTDTRFPASETRIGGFQSSPPFNLQGASNSNLTILEQSRALSTLPLPVNPSSYPLSPHSLFAGTNPSTTLGTATSYLASSPTMLSTSFLYPHLYSGSPTQAQYQYLEGSRATIDSSKSLDLLSNRQDLGSVRSRLSLTPPSDALKMDTSPPKDQQQLQATRAPVGLLPEGIPPQTTASALPLRDPSAPHGPLGHDNGDPSSVWRPY